LGYGVVSNIPDGKKFNRPSEDPQINIMPAAVLLRSKTVRHVSRPSFKTVILDLSSAAVSHDLDLAHTG
jgi:hypothetical protein